jgi:hypothetical protein
VGESNGVWRDSPLLGLRDAIMLGVVDGEIVKLFTHTVLMFIRSFVSLAGYDPRRRAARRHVLMRTTSSRQNMPFWGTIGTRMRARMQARTEERSLEVEKFQGAKCTTRFFLTNGVFLLSCELYQRVVAQFV